MSRIHKTSGAGFSRRALLVLCALLITGTARAEGDRYEVAFAKTLTFRGGKVTIENRFGSLTVRTEAGSKVSVRAKIRASSPEYGQRIRILTSETGDGVSVRTVYPEGRMTRTSGENSYSVDYEITVPINAPLVLRNRFGDTRLDDHRAPATIENSHGKVTVYNTQGSKNIENAFGPVDVRDQDGNLVIRGSNGGVSVNNVGGTVDIANRFANVVVRDTRKPVIVRNTNGQVDLRNIGGAITIVNAFGNVSAFEIRGKTSITSTNAKVEVRNVSGETAIKNDFGNVVAIDILGPLSVSGRNLTVDARNVRGPASIDSEYGNITIIGVNGPANVRTSFGSTTVRDAGGPVSVENQNGAIVVSGLRAGRCQPISLRGSYSSIKLRIPASSGYAVNARTSAGRIVSSVSMSSKTSTDSTLSGTIGNGSCKLELLNENGNISISEE